MRVTTASQLNEQGQYHKSENSLCCCAEILFFAFSILSEAMKYIVFCKSIDIDINLIGRGGRGCILSTGKCNLGKHMSGSHSAQSRIFLTISLPNGIIRGILNDIDK